MDDVTKRTQRVAYQPPMVKPYYSNLVRSPKKRIQLDAIRVVEQTIVGSRNNFKAPLCVSNFSEY